MKATYTVKITNPGATGDSAGFIDIKRIEQYGVNDSVDPTKNVTLEQSMNKKRGNLRCNRILSSIMVMSNIQVLKIETKNASATSEGSEFNMTLAFDSEDSVFIIRGNLALRGVDAIKQLLAEDISSDDSQVCDYYAPGAVAQTAELYYGKIQNEHIWLEFTKRGEIKKISDSFILNYKRIKTFNLLNQA
jgi:hypothetical protein